MNTSLKATAIGALTALTLSGCLLDEPRWGDHVTATTDKVFIKATPTHDAHPVIFECTTAGHGGLVPWLGPNVWTHIQTVNPVPQGSSYAASSYRKLPPECWYTESSGTSFTAIRARQISEDGTQDVEFVTKKADGSLQQYSGSSEYIRFVIISTS